MMPWRLSTIRGRLALAQLVTGAVAIGVAALALGWLLVDRSLTNTARSLISEAALVRRLVAVSGPQAGAGQATVDLGVRVTVVAPDGTVLAETHAEAAAMEQHGDRPELEPVLRGGAASGTARRRSGTLGASMLYVAVPLDDGGAVRLALPLAQVYSDIALQVGLIVWVLLLAGAVAAYAGVRIADSISVPVERMTTAALEMAKGELEVRVGRAGPVEMEQLAFALNLLAENLQARLGELEVGRERLDAMVKHMESGVLLVDGRGKIRVLNPATGRLLGLGGRDLGSSYDRCLPAPALIEATRAALSGVGAARLQVELGQPRPLIVEADVVPVHARTPDGGGAVLVLHDVTAVRRVEAMRRDFVANVSHELKTPLTSIQGFAETLLTGALEQPETARRFVGIISSEAERMAALVRDLLTLAHLEGDPQAVRPQVTDLLPVLRQALDRLAPAAAAAGVTLVPPAADVPTPVLADPEQLEHVVLNLLDNAVKYNVPGGQVEVTVGAAADQVQVTVADTGQGMPPDALSRIFERFYRVDKGRSRKAGGTGLGLAIVKHIVEAHGGQVWAESEPGQGTRMHFTLPAAQPAGSVKPVKS